MDALRRRIIHTLSHEFRTPLVSINTGTELLIDQIDDLDKNQLKNLLESILRGGQRLERLVDDFMLLQQLDLGHAENVCTAYRTVCSLEKLAIESVNSFVEGLSEKIKDKVQIIFQNNVEALDLAVDVYDTQIINVIERILSNAVKFAGIENPIKISLENVSDKVCLVIRDYGPGIPERSSLDVFQPFVQCDRDVHEQQGCGFGLTIAAQLVKVNGGKMQLKRPIDGVGLEARLEFPRVIAD